MKPHLLLIFTLYISIHNACAQDVLYTTAGNKILAKVLEINTNEIKYKEFINLEGPAYVIYNTDVVLIQFANGSTQIINPNAATLKPVKTETEISSKQIENKLPNLYYINPNLLSINALALANGDITLMYDREFLESKLSLSVLGGYNFNSYMGHGGLNLLIAQSVANPKKNYDLGLGINFMPNNTKRGQYFVGLLGKYMSYTYDETTVASNNQYVYSKTNGYQMAIMVTNGLLMRISQNFNFKVFGSIGVPINSPSLNKDYSVLPKIYLGYCFGYRF